MINLDSITNENGKEDNQNWPDTPDHPYKILVIGGSGSGKTNALINLINEKNDIDEIYLYAKDLSKPNYEYLMKKRKDRGINPVMIKMHLFIVQILWMIFMSIFMIIIQAEK